VKRRHYLAGLCGSVTACLAGCVSGDGSSQDGGPTAESASDSNQTVTSRSDGDRTPRSDPVTGSDGTPPDICDRQPRPNAIPAIVEPAFEPDYSGLSEVATLSESAPVIGVEREGQSRAYPLSILATNEIVNDSFDDPGLVT